jgi:gluconolactonase
MSMTSTYPQTVHATGFQFPEGPSFDNDGNLFIAELAAGRVSKMAPDGTWQVFADLGGSPNGTAFGPDGHLYVCNNGGWWAPEESTGNLPGKGGQQPKIQRLTLGGDVEDVVVEIDGRPLNSPNDLCFDASGNYYFTDPIWPNDEGIVIPGDICFVSSTGDARRVHTGLIYPNGLAVFEDQSTLVVAESGTGRLVAFDLPSPGVLTNERTFGWLGIGVIPDGMCLDSTGRLLVCGHGSGKIHVFPGEGGLRLLTVEIDDKDVTNVCFGGPDFSTLYITASDHGQIITVPWDVPGMKLFVDRAE